jgi:type IX secretion system PorP/SprF family membrane protein
MRKYSFIVALTCCAIIGNAQQIQMSSLAQMQGLLYNPSMAGVEQKMTLGVMYRAQWTGVSGAPKTATAFGSFDLPEHKIGLGGYLFSDKTGATSRTGLEVAFAKHLPINNDAQFSIGLEARATQYSIDIGKLSQTLGTDPVLASGSNKFTADAGFGVSYIDKHFTVGASVLQLFQTKLGYYSGSLSPTEEGKLYRHYYFHGAYKWNVDADNQIIPSFFLVYLPNAPTDFQAEMRLEHAQIFYCGIGARINQGVILSAGVHIKKKLTVGYVFDIYSTPYNTYESGGNAHELMVRYDISK